MVKEVQHFRDDGRSSWLFNHRATATATTHALPSHPMPTIPQHRQYHNKVGRGVINAKLWMQCCKQWHGLGHTGHTLQHGNTHIHIQYRLHTHTPLCSRLCRNMQVHTYRITDTLWFTVHNLYTHMCAHTRRHAHSLRSLEAWVAQQCSAVVNCELRGSGALELWSGS